ncbi:hypothetical protein F8M41_024868 [Gigaspora margarita]|uniref:Uncharacterized protein n=1 Tax=Gigaspora margarita TaxID=4874 RepID=A0A8H3ZYI6_GIGMA|nr:hypothetical protein F8M41_017865 [Gigaspora margarita]KAF0473740.1 hypothetical protein F8M41_024868 [Gigaspora margarita]
MPPLGINSIIVGTTTQTAKPVRDDLVLVFYVEERIEEKEPQVFGDNETASRKHVMILEDISMINLTCNNSDALFATPRGCPNLLFSDTSKEKQVAHLVRYPRTPRNKRTSLSSINPTSTSTLLLVLETNPIPNMSDQQSSQNHSNEPNREN